MDIIIEKGSRKFLKDCESALKNSVLGTKYFSVEGSAGKALEEGFENEEIFLAFDNKDNCLGFVWVIMNGVFHSFPYLHIIAVKKEYRGMGIGRQLLRYIEELCFQNSSKVFLVVADFNLEARKLYEAMGYREVGILPSLYRKGITEYLMMKVSNQNE